MWESSSNSLHLKLVKAWRQWLLQNPSVSLWNWEMPAFIVGLASVRYLPKFTTCELQQGDASVWPLFWLLMRFIVNKWQAGYSEPILVQTTALWQDIHAGVHCILLILAVLPDYSCMSSTCCFGFFQFTWVCALLIWFSIPIIISVLLVFYLRTQMSFHYASRAVLFSCRCAILSVMKW